MNNFKKLFVIFSALSDKEVKRLYKFIKSPYFNQSAEVVQFFEFIRSYYPGFESIDLTPAKMSAKLFNPQGVKVKKLYNLAYKLTALIDDFLVQQQLEKERGIYERLLGVECKHKGLDKYWFNTIERRAQILDKKLARGSDYFRERSQLLSDTYFSPFQTHAPGYLCSELEQLSVALDQQYYIEKLRCGVEMLHRRIMYGNKNEKENYFHGLDFLTEEFLAQAQKCEIPSIDIYIAFIRFFSKKTNLTSFEELQLIISLFKQKASQLQSSELLFMINKLISILNQNFLKGDEQFIKLSFELYKWGYEKNLYPSLFNQNNKGKTLKDSTYLNVLLAAILSGELNWAERFIETQKKYLSDQHREEAYTLARAYLTFFKCDYEAALDILRVLSIRNINYSNRISFLQIRCFVELYLLGDKSQLEILSNYVKRLQKNIAVMPDRQRMAYQNTLNIIMNIIRTKEKESVLSPAKWRRKVDAINQMFNAILQSEDEYVMAPSWLREKISTL